MIFVDTLHALELVCRETGKWGLYLNLYVPDGDDGWEEAMKACPFLTPLEGGQILFDGRGYALFDSKEEMERHFWLCVGDDGPTQTNPYNGEARVYAISCSPQGQLLNENT